MILTGHAISHEISAGNITIVPFEKGKLNPNSYNYCVSDTMYKLSSIRPERGLVEMEAVSLTGGKWLLRKGSLYLSTTKEVIGSSKYVTSLIGRSSIGRLGLFVQISANVGHQGTQHKWTLELVPCVDIYIRPYQPIGQVSFWMVQGEQSPYSGIYGTIDGALPSKLHVLR